METPAVGTPNKFELGELLLEIGALLMVSGANTERIKITIDRIASAFDCFTNLMITNHANAPSGSTPHVALLRRRTRPA